MKDINNRMHGFVASNRHIIMPERSISDEILAARIRSKMGRYISHPHAITITANRGKVSLRGIALKHEVGPFLHALKSMPGVTEISNFLEIHRKDENLPTLQGGIRRTGEHWDIFQTQWSPATRVITGALGGLLLIGGRKRRQEPARLMTRVTGAAICLRALTNQEFTRLLGIRREKSSVRIQKIINIQAPLDRAYKFLADPIQFPKFLKGINEVNSVNETHFNWLISGPFGISVSSETLISLKIPNKVISWKSLPGSSIEHFGSIHFRSTDEGTTRIETDIFYYPPVGMVGHFIARLFRVDPKSKLDDTFAEIKTLLEQGPSMRQLKRVPA